MEVMTPTVYSQLLNGLPDIAPNLDINTQMRIRSGRLELRNAANSFSYNILGGALTANRNLYLPLLTGDDTLVTLNLAQDADKQGDKRCNQYHHRYS